MARRAKRRNPIVSFFVTFFVSIILVAATTASICCLALVWYVNTYVNPSVALLDLANMDLNLTTIIYAEDPETGEYIEYEKLYQSGENRVWVDYEDIPIYMGQAFVAIEDERFYTHQGVDWKRTAGAVLGFVGGTNSSYGGSTITQQLIKNLTNENEYSVRRKVNEIFRALELEKELGGDKNRILELYMNTIPFGNSAHGVQAAAYTYFNKDVSELTLAECAAIAGITNAPTKYNPFTNPENTKERQELILGKMLELGMISTEEYTVAKNQELLYERPQVEEDVLEPYSYFTDAIITDLVQDLKDQKGYSDQLAEKIVLTGGLRVYATIDLDIQDIMDEVYQNDDNFPDISNNGETPQSAMVVMEPGGKIVGLVGGRGEKTGSRVLNRTESQRQPGSSIKPVSTYAPAVDLGLITPYSVLTDEAVMEVNGSSWPRNDSGTYSGQIVLKTAVARSVNTIAVQVLQMLTPEYSFDFLTQKLGMEDSLVSHRTTSSGSTVTDIDLAPLALGGLTDGVTVREMAGAYGIFINNGDYVKPFTYSKVTYSDGEILISNEDIEPIHALENEKTVYYMNTILQGVTESGGTASSVNIDGISTAGKTGTTTANRDRWFCGYTPYYVCTTWFGYDSSYELGSLSSNPSTELWKDVMYAIHEDLPDKSFELTNDNFSMVKYCTLTGLLPSSSCTTATGNYYKGDAPKVVCSGHYVAPVEPEVPEETVDPLDPLLDPEGTVIDPETGTSGQTTDTTTTDPSTTDPATPVDPEGNSEATTPDTVEPIEPVVPADTQITG